MNIEFLKAKNGENTFCVDKVFFHSSYAPSKETERFLASINFPYKPEIIFIIEPGFDYLINPLKSKFPDIKIVCIRLLKDFENNKNWDSVIFYKSKAQFESELLYKYDETKLLKSFMLTWAPTANLFKKENSEIWEIYKKCLDSSKTLLITRQYFEKKWFYNSCRFFTFITNPCLVKTQNDFPIVITASGPSLKKCLPFLKKYKDNFFLISASSSLSVLIANQIIPDMVISTDGGFWAAEHLKILAKKYKEIPIALANEAFVQAEILLKNPIIPLRYKDGPSDSFFDLCKLPFMNAERNGTVSGTALTFAESISSGTIYFCGLDLGISKGFQHTQPNELEKNNAIKDFRINNKSTRCTKSEVSNAGLEIYLNWFCKHNYKNKTYRIIEKAKNSIKGISDINYKDFELLLEKTDRIQKTDLLKPCEKLSIEQKNENCKKILKFIEKNQNSEEWKQQIFPIDYVSLSHADNKNDKEKILLNLEEKNQKLIERLRKLLNG